ncbi:NADH-ubiquinone oxidoreductase subunit E family protein [Malaciobacter marinus]|jgi:NADH-quinone oxidoreductase subunit E|uniref:NADH-ubiquinone oxidoreductase subunit E family protein n=1 Tax=Malaciobacter TaxID=2321114 RepID=UPI0009A8BBE2|nr:NADH-ubiquinone oxidoreductase subunit E family protein [Malaciobacter marinus]SKB34049.1 NADH-quinone oxidoreductase subunit E [Malaciobacter marinus]
MKRFDLRLLKDNFYDRMLELMKTDVKDGENAIFLFEIGDFSAVQKSADLIYENGYTLMNSIKFNEVDWTIVVKKVQAEKKEIETKEEE